MLATDRRLRMSRSSSARRRREVGQNAGAESDGALDLASTRAPVLILDLGHVSLMDAGAGSLLVRADRRIRRAGGRLLVVAGRTTCSGCSR
jgi:hypothetical protein